MKKSDLSDQIEKYNENLIVKEIAAVITEIKTNLAKEVIKSVTYSRWQVGRIITKNESENNNCLECNEFEIYANVL